MVQRYMQIRIAPCMYLLLYVVNLYNILKLHSIINDVLSFSAMASKIPKIERKMRARL